MHIIHNCPSSVLDEFIRCFSQKVLELQLLTYQFFYCQFEMSKKMKREIFRPLQIIWLTLFSWIFYFMNSLHFLKVCSYSWKVKFWYPLYYVFTQVFITVIEPHLHRDRFLVSHVYLGSLLSDFLFEIFIRHLPTSKRANLTVVLTACQIDTGKKTSIFRTGDL